VTRMARALALDHVQIAMPRGQEAQARRFYGDLLGLPEIPKPANLRRRGGAWFACGALQVHLGVEDSFLPAKKAHAAFIVDDLSGIATALKQQGHVVTSDVDQVAGATRLFTEDPFGNRVELIERGKLENRGQV
jgi:catechol 2,3-dioxygenase-like lactoylglutathione lyase family enzyme